MTNGLERGIPKSLFKGLDEFSLLRALCSHSLSLRARLQWGDPTPLGLQAASEFLWGEGRPHIPLYASPLLRHPTLGNFSLPHSE